MEALTSTSSHPFQSLGPPPSLLRGILTAEQNPEHSADQLLSELKELDEAERERWRADLATVGVDSSDLQPVPITLEYVAEVIGCLYEMKDDPDCCVEGAIKLLVQSLQFPSQQQLLLLINHNVIGYLCLICDSDITCLALCEYSASCDDHISLEEADHIRKEVAIHCVTRVIQAFVQADSPVIPGTQETLLERVKAFLQHSPGAAWACTKQLEYWDEHESEPLLAFIQEQSYRTQETLMRAVNLTQLHYLSSQSISNETRLAICQLYPKIDSLFHSSEHEAVEELIGEQFLYPLILELSKETHDATPLKETGLPLALHAALFVDTHPLLLSFCTWQFQNWTQTQKQMFWKHVSWSEWTKDQNSYAFCWTANALLAVCPDEEREGFEQRVLEHPMLRSLDGTLPKALDALAYDDSSDNLQYVWLTSLMLRKMGWIVHMLEPDERSMLLSRLDYALPELMLPVLREASEGQDWLLQLEITQIGASGEQRDWSIETLLTTLAGAAEADTVERLRELLPSVPVIVLTSAAMNPVCGPLLFPHLSSLPITHLGTLINAADPDWIDMNALIARLSQAGIDEIQMVYHELDDCWARAISDSVLAECHSLVDRCTSVQPSQMRHGQIQDAMRATRLLSVIDTYNQTRYPDDWSLDISLVELNQRLHQMLGIERPAQTPTTALSTAEVTQERLLWFIRPWMADALNHELVLEASEYGFQTPGDLKVLGLDTESVDTFKAAYNRRFSISDSSRLAEAEARWKGLLLISTRLQEQHFADLSALIDVSKARLAKLMRRDPIRRILRYFNQPDLKQTWEQMRARGYRSLQDLVPVLRQHQLRPFQLSELVRRLEAPLAIGPAKDPASTWES